MKPHIRILIVEDDLDTARSMCVVMSSFGHDVVVANDDVSAVILATATDPDFVLLDVGLPRHEEVGRRLRANLGPHSIFIAVSGHERRCAGCDLHLLKPVNLEEVNALLTRLHRWDERPACRPPRRFASNSRRHVASMVS